LEFARLNEEHGGPDRRCISFACGVSLQHDDLLLAGLALEFKDLKAAAFMASDG
jgi:hypothetical protein